MEIHGIITDIKKSNTKDTITFNVKTESETVQLTAYFYLPVHKNDLIYAHCAPANAASICAPKSSKTLQYRITAPPMVLIDTKNKQNTIFNIMNALELAFPLAVSYYNEVESQQVDNVCTHLQSMAEDWHHRKNTSIFTMVGHENLTYDTAKLLRYWYKNFNLRQLRLLDLTNREIKHYKNHTSQEIFNQCLTNPHVIYTLSDLKCSSIVNRMHLTLTKEHIVCGKIVRYLYECLDTKKWMCVPQKHLITKFPNLNTLIKVLQLEYDIIIDNNCFYIKSMYLIEEYVSTFISNFINSDPVKDMSDPLNTYYIGKNNQEFIRYPAVFSSNVSDDQKIAIQAALDHRFVLIVGMPGCGKTKTISEIVHNLELRELKYLVTSFTGRSIERVREVISERGQKLVGDIVSNIATMHRLIYNAQKGIKNDYDIVIIDEVSMVTTELFYQFIKIFKEIKQFVLVGDVNQLPPIDHGALLQELLKSDKVPIYKLTKNHRVDNLQDDGILLNIYNIAKSDYKSTFKFVETSNFNVSVGGIALVYNILNTFKQSGFTSNDIVIISPYKKYLRELNTNYQSIFNPTAKHVVDQFGNIWKENDRVMMKKNMSDKNIFNGQQGKVTVVTKQAVYVDFGPAGIKEFKLQSKYVNRKSNESDSEDEVGDNELTVQKLQHAYCITTHKAQGSEADVVIIYIDSEYDSSSFLNRNLLYTAISRAKQFVWIVTTKLSLITNAIKTPLPYRCENLGARIKQLCQ